MNFDHKEVDYRPQKGRFSSPARGFPTRIYLTNPPTTNPDSAIPTSFPGGSLTGALSHHIIGPAEPALLPSIIPGRSPGPDRIQIIHNPYRSPRPVQVTKARTGHQGPYRSPRPVQVTKARTGHQGPYRSPRPVQVTKARTGHQGPYRSPRPVQVTKARTGHQGRSQVT